MNSDPQDLSVLLREAPVPPTRITVDNALSLGRKAVRRRRSGITATASIAVAIAAAAGGLTLARPAPAPTPLTLPSTTPSASPSPSPARVDYSKWTPTTLPLPDGVSKARVAAMDSSGRYVLGSADNDRRAILWDGLTPSLLPLPTPARGVDPVDVNASGVVIGNALAAGTSWVYHDGVITKLLPTGGGYYAVRDINDRGDIVGWSQYGGTLVWPAGNWNAAARQLSNVDDAFALGEDGTVGGSNNRQDHPVVVTPDGQLHNLVAVPGKPGGHIFHISGDWACGWVAGVSASYPIPARWRLSTGELTSFSNASGNCTGVARSGAMLAYGDNLLHPNLLITPEGTLITMPTGGKPGIPTLLDITADATAIAGNIVIDHDEAEPTRIPTIWHRTS